jgi:phosphoribosylformylglycinamidine synthase
MSMKTRWQEGNEEREMTSPLSLVISAFARVEDVRHTITPQLSTEDNALLLIDLGKGNNALGATALAQVAKANKIPKRELYNKLISEEEGINI